MPKAGPLAFVAVISSLLGAAWYLRGTYPVGPGAAGETGRPGEAPARLGGVRPPMLPGIRAEPEESRDRRRGELSRRLEEVGTQIADEEAYLRERSQELDRMCDPSTDEGLRAERAVLEAELAMVPKSQEATEAEARSEIFARYAAQERERAVDRQARKDRLERTRNALRQQEAQVARMQTAIREQRDTGVLTDELRAMEERAPLEQRRLADLRAQTEALTREAMATEALEERQRRWEERADQQRLRESTSEAAGGNETRRRKQEARLSEITRQQSERQQQKEALESELNEARRRLLELEHWRTQLRQEMEVLSPLPGPLQKGQAS